jgi:large conductance mechanosensitive channel
LTPIIGSIFGSTDFSSLTIHLRGDNAIAYGAVLNAIISFLAVAAAVYFLVIVPLNAMQARRQKQAEPTTRPASTVSLEGA